MRVILSINAMAQKVLNEFEQKVVRVQSGVKVFKVSLMIY